MNNKKYNSYIYVIKHKKNKFYYVGQRRISKNMTAKDDFSYMGSGKFIQYYIKKKGTKNLVKNILIEGLFTLKQLNNLEIKYIAEYKNKYGEIKTGGKCVNFTNGGEQKYFKKSETYKYKTCKNCILINNGSINKYIKNDETIPKGWKIGSCKTIYNNGKHEHHFGTEDVIPSDYVKGRLPFSKKTKKKQSISAKKRGFKGKAKGFPCWSKGLTKETSPSLMAVSLKLTGRKVKKKTRELQRINNLGENNPSYGKHWYNNGKINVYKYKCPKGFKKGRLFNPHKYKK